MKSITGFASQSASTLYIAPDGEWRDTNYRSQARDSSFLGGMLDWVIGRRGRAAGAHVAAFTRADVLLEGRMLKLGAYVRSWKERYFILRADTRSLCYYDGQHSLQLLGEVVINKETSVSIEPFPEPPGSTCLCVQCGVSKRKYYMRASDDATLMLWRDAIAAMIEPSESMLEHVAPPREEVETSQHHDLLPEVVEKGEVEQVEEEEQEEQAEVAEAVAGGRAGRERTNWWWAIKEHMETEYEDAPLQVTLRLRQSQDNIETSFTGDVFVGVFFSRGRAGRSLGDSLNLLIRRKVLSRVATAESPLHQLDWSVLGRTENVRVGEDKLRGDQPNIVKNFSVLLRLPKSTSDLTLLFVLFAASSQDHEIEANPAMAAVVIPFGTLKARLGVSKASSPSTVLLMVTVAADDPVSAAASRGLEQALIALSPIRSPALHSLLQSTTHLHHTRPYARQYYCAHVQQGRLLACEELFLPVLAMAVPRAYIDLVCTERLELVRRLKEDLSEWLIASAEAGSMLMPMLRLLQELQMTIVDVYLECKAYYDACIQAADDPGARRTGIHLPPSVGASTHRRSVLKKALHWQFVPINHNIQMTYTSLLPPETPEGGSPQRETTAIMPTVTLGLCTAHPLGYSQGGLRSLLSASGLGSASTRFGQDALHDVLTFDVLRALRHEFLSAVQARITVSPLFPATTTNERSPSTLEDDDEHSKLLHSLPSYRLLRQSLRADTVCCQCLSMAICSLATLVNVAVVSPRHRVILARVVHGAGYLVGVESLLSTALKESGMIEDMSMAVGWLNTVSVRLTTAKPPPPEEPLIDLYGDGQPDVQVTPTAAAPPSPMHTPAPASPSHTREEQYVGRAVEGVAVWRRQTDKRLVVDVNVSPEAADVLRGIIAEYGSCSPRASVAVEGGEQRVDSDLEVLTVVPLTGVLFTQGINELQTISNNFSRSTLQQEVNAAAVDVLERYTRKYIEVIDRLESSGDLLGGEKAELQHLLSQCREALTDRSIAKNVGVLLAGSDLCRALVGVVSVGCKSGKDRTAMAVALEQTRFLCQNYGITDGVQLCQTIRKHGVRRTNVFANTGHPAYAFSSITQERLTIFPPCYRAPPGTYSGKAVT